MSISPLVATPSRARRVQHEIVRREVRVMRVQEPSPGFRAITFGGDSLAGFTSLGFDDHVKFIFEDASGALQRRDYTPRHFDPVRRELTIEFALHGHGPAAAWAAGAVPGQAAIVAGPRGSFVLPDDLDWQLLVGDASALPAVARRLEELRADCRALVVMQLDDAAHVRTLPQVAAPDLHWVHDSAALLAAVRALPLPGGVGHAWCAAEANCAAAVRRVLVDERGLHPHAVHAAAYWKQGVQAHHERLEPAP